MRWLQVVLGLWLMLSPWLLGYESISVMMWNNLLIGIALVLTGLWEMYGGRSENKNNKVQ